MTTSEDTYGPEREVPVTELAQEIASDLGIEIEDCGPSCFSFIGWDRRDEEQTEITITAYHDEIDVDFDAEGSTGPRVQASTREQASTWLRDFMQRYAPLAAS